MEVYHGVVGTQDGAVVAQSGQVIKRGKTTTGSEKKVALVHCACPGSRSSA